MYVKISATLIFSWLILDIVYGNRFKLHHQVTATWEEAKVICEENGHVLAKVDSASDHALVEKVAPYSQGFFWIGLYGNVTTTKFTWVDSEEVDYSNWATGFPGLHEGVTCTRIREFDFKWETSDCNARLNFMCEDPYHKISEVVTMDTKMKGFLMGTGVIGGVLLISCLLLQLPCCRSGVTQKISRIGFGTRDVDRKMIVS